MRGLKLGRLRHFRWAAACWVLAFAFLGAAYAFKVLAGNDVEVMRNDYLILSASEVNRLGGRFPPRWDDLKQTYGLSDAQVRRSVCLTRSLSPCSFDLSRDGQERASPVNGRLILSLSDDGG